MAPPCHLYPRIVLSLHITFPDSFKHQICDMNEQTSMPFCYWECSKVVAEDCATVPPMARDQKDRATDRGRENYKPWCVSGRNSASNLGFAHILSRIFNSFQYLHAHRLYGYNPIQHFNENRLFLTRLGVFPCVQTWLRSHLAGRAFFQTNPSSPFRPSLPSR